jgi:hypothetical protein
MQKIENVQQFILINLFQNIKHQKYQTSDSKQMVSCNDKVEKRSLRQITEENDHRFLQHDRCIVSSSLKISEKKELERSVGHKPVFGRGNYPREKVSQA